MDATTRRKLRSALIQADKRNRLSDFWTPTGLARDLESLAKVDRLTPNGKPIGLALQTCFNDRLRTILEHAAGPTAVYGGRFLTS